MHIIQCLTHSKIGGGQQVVFLLTKSLLNDHPELRLTVILPANGIYTDRFRSLGVSTVEFPFDRISVKNIFKIFFLLKGLKPDLVHSHGKGAGLYARFLPGFLLKAGFIHSYHGYHPLRTKIKDKIYRLIERMLLVNTDFIVNVSETERKTVEQNYHVDGSRSMVIRNIVDVKALQEDAGKKLPQELESFLGRIHDPFIVAMVGRNDPLKNYPLAFEVAKLIIAGERNSLFLFVGIDPDDENFVSLKDLYPQNVYAAGLLPDIAPVLDRSHVVMLTSKSEGSPLVILEAFALGKPVVCTRVPGIADLVDHTTNGLLCGESPLLLANAIHLLKKDRHLYKHLQNGATEKAAHLDAGRWAGEYLSLYTKISGR